MTYQKYKHLNITAASPLYSSSEKYQGPTKSTYRGANTAAGSRIQSDTKLAHLSVY